MPREPSAAKVSAPRIFGVVPRKRLFRLLDERLKHPFVWIEGPPGSGKTVLTVSYLSSRRRSVSSFFYYLGLAAGKRGRGLPMLTSDYLGDTEGFARRFFREFFRRLPDRCVVVIDNIQDIPEESATHALLASAVREIPEESGLIALSRSAPPRPYAVHEANGVLTRLTWDDLRLTSSETSALCARRRDLGQATIDTLHELSGGWVAGLTLMLEHNRTHKEALEDVPSITREALFSYFAAEIMLQFPEDDRRVITETAVFPSVTSALAGALTGRQDAGAVLESLHRRRLFTDRRIRANRSTSPPEYVYEYHALFRTFLLDDLGRRYARCEFERLSVQAGILLEQCGEADAALSLFAGVRDWSRVEAVIDRAAPRLLGQGRWRTLREWIGALPEERAAASASMLLWLARASAPSSRGEARRHFEAAFISFKDCGDLLGQLEAVAGIVGALFLEARATERFGPWIPILDTLIDQIQAFPSAEVELSAATASLLANIWLHPAHPRIHQTALRMLELLDSNAGLGTKVSAAAAALQYAKNAGQLSLGDCFLARIDALLAESETPAHLQTMWAVSRGCHLYGLGKLDEAETALRQAADLAHDQGLPQFEKHALEFLAYIYAFLGRQQSAESVLAAHERLPDRHTPVVRANHLLGRVFALQLAGKPDQALRTAGLAVEAARETGAPFFVIAWMAALAGVLAEAGQFAEARQYVLEARALARGTCYEVFEGLLLFDEAYVAHLQGNESAVSVHLQASLAWTRQHELPQVLRWSIRGAPILFSEAIRLGVETGYVTTLIEEWRLPAPDPHVAHWPWPLRIECLGGLRIVQSGTPMHLGRKAPVRLLELLKLLVCAFLRPVAIDDVANTLWPEADGDAAEASLANALHRLRRLLGSQAAVVLNDNKLSLDPKHVWVDAWVLDRQCREADSAVGGANADVASIRASVTKILALYRGSFLTGDNQPWVRDVRERLRASFAKAVICFGTALEARGAFDDAVRLYERAIELDELAESFHVRLMVCQRELGSPSLAIETYRRLRARLSIVLGLEPSAEATTLYDSLMCGE